MSDDQDTLSLENGGTIAAVALLGRHHSTLATTLALLGASKSENVTWPAYTSSLEIELFRNCKGQNGMG